MSATRSKTIGLRTGLIILGILAIIGVFTMLRPTPLASITIDKPTNTPPRSVDTLLSDSASQAYLTKLRVISPGIGATLDGEATAMIADGQGKDELADLLLRSILSELKRGAFEFKQAPTEHYDKLIIHSGTALTRLQAEKSDWCSGPRIAAFLEQDESALIPDLLARYPYGSDSYNWAMDFAIIYLDAIAAARKNPIRRPGPTAFDKKWLQQTGLALGSDQWALGLQIAVFSQAEGQGFHEMKQAISGIDACELGLAAIEVSGNLPEQVRSVIWTDLLPELFHGNTPYVLWRVNDYFFLD